MAGGSTAVIFVETAFSGIFAFVALPCALIVGRHIDSQKQITEQEEQVLWQVDNVCWKTSRSWVSETTATMVSSRFVGRVSRCFAATGRGGHKKKCLVRSVGAVYRRRYCY